MMRVAFLIVLVATALPAQIRVSTIKPSSDVLVSRQTVRGDVLPWQEATLRSRVTGVLATLPFLEGQTIEGRDVATLSVPDLIAESERARAATAAAAAARAAAAAEGGVLDGEIAMLRASIPYQVAKEAVAAADLAMRKMIAKRKKGLASERAGTPAQAEDAEAEVRLAEARLQATKAETSKARAAVTRAQKKAASITARVASMEAKRQAAEAMEKLSATRIGFAMIKNPFKKSVVTMRHVDPGELIEADTTPILTVMDTSKVRVRFGLQERDALRLGIQAEISMRLQTDPHNPMMVKVSRIAGDIAKRTRTRWVEVDLPNGDGKLLPGTYVYFDLEFRSKPGAVTVPSKFAILGRGRPHVLVAEGNRVVRRPVVIGLEGISEKQIDDPTVKKKIPRYEIVSGLGPDDQIITSSVAALRAGDAITPVLEKSK
ncbi:MAG: hypothetical protein CMJ83_21555 [Planctomycetes bacterium]|nr:hypothetical protein [Planctomycetota bacterium]